MDPYKRYEDRKEWEEERRFEEEEDEDALDIPYDPDLDSKADRESE